MSPSFAKDSRGWTTADELDFINELSKKPRTEAEKSLDGYLKGAEKRVRWGKIDRKRAISRAAFLLVCLRRRI